MSCGLNWPPEARFFAGFMRHHDFASLKSECDPSVAAGTTSTALVPSISILISRRCRCWYLGQFAAENCVEHPIDCDT